MSKKKKEIRRRVWVELTLEGKINQIFKEVPPSLMKKYTIPATLIYKI